MAKEVSMKKNGVWAYKDNIRYTEEIMFKKWRARLRIGPVWRPRVMTVEPSSYPQLITSRMYLLRHASYQKSSTDLMAKWLSSWGQAVFLALLIQCIQIKCLKKCLESLTQLRSFCVSRPVSTIFYNLIKHQAQILSELLLKRWFFLLGHPFVSPSNHNFFHDV